MTDYFSHSQMSFNSPLRFTPLKKSHWFFFIFGTLSSRVIPNPHTAKPNRKRGLLPLVATPGSLYGVSSRRECPLDILNCISA